MYQWRWYFKLLLNLIAFNLPQLRPVRIKVKFDYITLFQKLAIPTIIKGRNCLFAAETGSGKTLTYAAPLLHRLLQLRRTHDLPVAGLPRALVLTPSRELADQTSLAVKRFAQFTNINVHLSVSGKDSVNDFQPFCVHQKFGSG